MIMMIELSLALIIGACMGSLVADAIATRRALSEAIVRRVQR